MPTTSGEPPFTDLDFAIHALKHVAIFVGTVSGFIGVVGKSRDDKSGRLTQAGKGLVACIIASGVIGLATQGYESVKYMENLTAQQRAEDQRKADSDKSQKKHDEEQLALTKQLQSAISSATTASENASKAAKSSETANQLVNSNLTLTGQTLSESRLATNKLTRLAINQQELAAASWRIQRPFGTWTMNFAIQVEPTDDVRRIVRQWAQRVLSDEKLTKKIREEGGGGLFVEMGNPLAPNSNRPSEMALVEAIEGIDLYAVIHEEIDPKAITWDSLDIRAKTRSWHIQNRDTTSCMLNWSIGIGFTSDLEVSYIDISYVVPGAPTYSSSFSSRLDLYDKECHVYTTIAFSQYKLRVFSMNNDNTLWPGRVELDPLDDSFTRVVKLGEQFAYTRKRLSINELGYVPRDYPGTLPKGIRAPKVMSPGTTSSPKGDAGD